MDPLTSMKFLTDGFAPRKKTRLKNLKLSELSLVDAGANQHSDVVLFKSAAPEDKEPDDPTVNLSRLQGQLDQISALSSLRDLLEQMSALLTPQPEISDRAVDEDIQDTEEEDKRRTAEYQSIGQRQADAQQAQRDAQDQASRDLAASVGQRVNADMLERMMELVMNNPRA